MTRRVYRQDDYRVADLAALAGHRAPVQRGGRVSPARLVPNRVFAGQVGRLAPVGSLAHRGLRPFAVRGDRQPGHSARSRGIEGDLRQRLADGRRRQHRLGRVPDLSLYPCDSVPELVERINNALVRADQIHHITKKASRTATGRTGWPRLSPTRKPALGACCTPTKSCST